MLINKYVYDLDQEDTFKIPLIYDVGYEKKINYEDIFGKFYINPEFKSAKMDPKLLADNLPDGFTKNNSNKNIESNFKNKEIKPEHHRLTTVGGSLSTMQGPFVFRGEGVYNSGKYFNVKIDQSDPNLEYPEGVVEKNEIKWMAGVDYNYADIIYFQTEYLF